MKLLFLCAEGPTLHRIAIQHPTPPHSFSSLNLSAKFLNSIFAAQFFATGFVYKFLTLNFNHLTACLTSSGLILVTDGYFWITDFTILVMNIMFTASSLFTNAWSRISPILTSLLFQRTQFSLNYKKIIALKIDCKIVAFFTENYPSKLFTGKYNTRHPYTRNIFWHKLF